MIEDSFITYKPEIVRVRLSSPFIARAKCKFCEGSPVLYYYVRNPTLWFNPRKVISEFEWVRKRVKKICWDNFNLRSPKDYRSITPFNHSPFYKGYRPRLHRTKGANPIADLVEFVTCECMQTSWAFSAKAIENRPEITNRKSRHVFPNRFEF
jgi:hypothetical protein